MSKTRGRIIRILDAETVMINLGRRDGVSRGSVFSVLSEPEVVVDPSTGEELGKVQLVKAKVRASGVYDRFTIAMTKWAVPKTNLDQRKALGAENADVAQGETLVDPKQIQPWRAASETPIRLGDPVEVSVSDQKDQKDKKAGPRRGGDGSAQAGPAKPGKNDVWDYSTNGA